MAAKIVGKGNKQRLLFFTDRALPPRVRLDRLHEIFQVAMGWTNSHLHEFRVGDARYGERVFQTILA